MGIVITGPGSPLSIGGGSGAKIYRYNNFGATLGVIVPANPQRQSVTFYNPGAVDAYIAPMVAFTSASAPAPVALSPSLGALGGCFIVYANGGSLKLTGECQGAWQAFAASGGNKFTVVDSNV